tara:strand:- start:387 stop:650 length:264 start_codon:yes stop_codon:yes gene_type:complete
MFKNVILFLILSVVFLFFYLIFLKYISNENIKKINLNRLNIDNKIENEYSDLIILENDTNNIIEFNSGFNTENEIKRNFWDLIKKND